MTAPKPGFYRLPQHCSSDRRRARKATLALRRSQYRLTQDPPLAGSDGDESSGLYLPPHLADLPAEEKFSAKKMAGFMFNKLRIKLNGLILNTAFDFGLSNYRGYAGLSRLVNAPEHAARHWRSDALLNRRPVVQ